MHKSCRRGIRDIILAGQLIEILLSQNDTYDHRVGILTITGICHRFPSSTGNIERSYPGDMSTRFGQSCSWAMPMRSKIEGKKGREHIWNKELGYRKGSRGPEASGWFFADQRREKTEIYCCCCGGTPYTLFLLAIPAMLSPSRIMLCLAAEAALAIPGFCCSKAGSG